MAGTGLKATRVNLFDQLSELTLFRIPRCGVICIRILSGVLVSAGFYFPSLDPALFDLDPSSTKFLCFYS